MNERGGADADNKSLVQLLLEVPNDSKFQTAEHSQFSFNSVISMSVYLELFGN